MVTPVLSHIGPVDIEKLRYNHFEVGFVLNATFPFLCFLFSERSFTDFSLDISLDSELKLSPVPLCT